MAVLIPASVSFITLLRLSVQLGYELRPGAEILGESMKNTGSGSERIQPRKAIFEEHGRFKVFEPGEEVITAGEEDEDIYFILDGEVKVVYLTAGGREIWHNLLGAGTTFGEMAALTGRPRAAHVIALQKTHVAVVSRREMMSLMQVDPSIALWLLTEMADRLYQANEMVRALVAQNIAQRVRAELVRLARPLDGDETGALVIEPAPNLSELARRLNTDRENVSREVSALAQRGTLRKETDRLVILDPAFLTATSAL